MKALVTLVLAAFHVSSYPGDASWTRWGGPSGDFKVAGPELVEAWPESGPRRLWDVELGDGFSAVLCRGDLLYTAYSEEENEIVVALDRKNGSLVWDYAYEAGRYPDMSRHFTEGPNATQLLLEDRLVTIGITGKVSCLNAGSGDPQWTLDLHAKFGRQKRREEYGYSGIPLEYQGKILVLVGGDQHAVVALDPADGSVAWGSAPGRVSYAPPALLNLGGTAQFVYFSCNEVIGLDPTNGKQLWSYPVECVTENNLTPAALCPEDHLWVACQLNGGTRVLKITKQQDGAFGATALWTSQTLKQGHWPSIVIGDYVYGALGDSNSLLGAVNWRTGETAWKERGFPAAQTVYADGRIILVDESGQVAMVRVSPEGPQVLCAAQVLDSVSWTVPTLVDTTLYVRDRKRIVALDLAKSSYEQH
jgi:outer membrane protein assembly factor BamB